MSPLTPSLRLQRRSSRTCLPLAALAIVAWAAGSSYAIDIVTIEEHWELSVGEPDAASSSPQVCMVMSPTGNLDGLYFVFTLNHHSLPGWIPGGLQVQLWNGEEVVDAHVGPQETTLNHADETLRWVQSTRLVDGQLVFEILNGESESWGEFGGLGYLKITTDTDMVNLNGYRPAISLEQSGVSFAGNRVRSLVLQQLRWIDTNGNAYELNAPIDVDADLDP
jgi:hypothetical protein